MPFKVPTLTELNNQVQQDIINAGVPGIETVLKNSVIGTIGTVQAGLSWSHYSFLGNIARQSVPWTATDEYLAGWGNLKNVYRKAPTRATGLVEFTVVDDSVIVPKGTQIRRNDGWSYVTTEDSIRNQAHIQSVENGIDGNSDQNAVLTLGQALAGVNVNVKVLSPITGGADLEDDDDYRSRVIQAFRTSGSLGREQEYIMWAESVHQVSRAWVGRNSFGSGTVVIWIMCDDANTSNNGFPIGDNGTSDKEKRYKTATGDQLAVANYIWDKQPVTSLVIVCSPIPQPVDFVISDLDSNNTLDNQNAIRAALKDLFRREAAPGKNMHPSAWDRAIASITTLTQYTISSPVTTIIAESDGNLPILGKVTFQT